MSESQSREGVQRRVLTFDAGSSLEYLTSSVHVRYAVRVEGDLQFAPRWLLVDAKNDALAIRDHTGRVIWLETGGHRYPPLESGLFPRSTDLVEEARALVDLGEAVDFAQRWGEAEVRLTIHHPGRVVVEDDGGGVMEVKADLGTGFVVSLTRSTPEGTEFTISALMSPMSANPETAFTMANLSWSLPARPGQR